MSFVDKLRMNNIFPANGYNPFGPPESEGMNLDEMSMIASRFEPLLERRKKADQEHEIRMLQMQQQGQLGNIAQKVAAPIIPNKPMDVIYQPNDPLAMKKRELDLKERDLTQRGDIAREGLGIKQNDSNIRQQIANLRIPEGQKLALLQKYGLEKISATTEGRNETENLRQTGRETLLDTRGNQNKVIQGVRGAQQLANIAATVAGQSNLADKNIAARADAAQLKANAPMAPNLARVAENNAARELVNSRPELAQFVQIDPINGNFVVVPSGDPVTDATIKNTIYDKMKNINLPSDTKKKTDTKKIEVKPSKYKVTVK